MASNSVMNRLKKLTIEERAEMKEKFADVSICRVIVCSSCHRNGWIRCVWGNGAGVTGKFRRKCQPPVPENGVRDE